MIDDILQNLIYKQTDHFGCNNCEQSFCMHYSNNNKICSGIIKQVNPDIPYDVIRLCIETTNDSMQPYDYTPDEAHSIITVLSHSVGDWMANTKAYQKFRKQRD